MSDDATDVASAIGRFDAAESRFLDAFDSVPDAALRFRPAGDDYALSGLIEHVTAILRGYGHVLDVLAAAPSGPEADVPHVPDAGSAQDVRLVAEGFAAEDRERALRGLREAHDALARRIRAAGDDALAVRRPIVHGSTPDPFPTAPIDVVGWVVDHYDEHVPHVASLVERWRAESVTA